MSPLYYTVGAQLKNLIIEMRTRLFQGFFLSNQTFIGMFDGYLPNDNDGPTKI